METTKENLPQDQEMNEKLQMQEAQLRLPFFKISMFMNFQYIKVLRNEILAFIFDLMLGHI